MSIDLDTFLTNTSDLGVVGLQGIHDERWEDAGWPARFFDTRQTDSEELYEYQESLEDILYDLDVPSFDFDDEGQWVNEEVALIAVLGLEEDGVIVQPEAFLVHSLGDGGVYLLELAPLDDAQRFEDLPRVAHSLEELRDMIVEK